MMMIAMGTYHWPLRRALRPWVALGAHGSLVCACGVVWAPFARGLVCFFMKTLQKAWKVENGSYGLEFLFYGLEFLTLGIYTDMPSKPRRAAASILFF